ncbi:hypothetical protein [Streptomyces boninensis]|uniref:hypothetical protein n=1 Tax=Streptomyces boninensis TaxID=2039455 RepID=UPI003B21D27A
MRAGIRRAAVVAATGLAVTALTAFPASAAGAGDDPESGGLLGQLFSMGILHDIANLADETADAVLDTPDNPEGEDADNDDQA